MNPTLLVSCYRSAVPLCTISTVCTHGWPLLNSFQATLIHPIYNFPRIKLITKMKELISAAEASEWNIKDVDLLELRLCMSAMMYSLDSFKLYSPESKQHIPSLPSNKVAIGSAARLLGLSTWYEFATSKRMTFPLYAVNRLAGNIEWQNFSSWLDAADSIRTEWEKGRTKHNEEETKRQRDSALLEVRASSVYKRIDNTKVWNWIDAQLAGGVPEGRRETFKTLFLKGDLSPEDWTSDDVDDVVEAILNNCDTGNEITHFINTRLNHIRALISEFYGSFTLLDSVTTAGASHPDLSPKEAAIQNEFFSSYDQRVESLDQLPPAPKRESFTSLALFLKATAQHSLLVRRFNIIKARG